MKKVTVLLADDHAIVRAALRHLLETAGDIEVIGEAADGEHTIHQAKKLLPAVILLDLAMPLMRGTDTIRDLVKAVPSCKVLILSAYQDVETVRASIEAGAAGYLIKRTASQELLAAIRQIDKGDTFLGSHIPHMFPRQQFAASPNRQKTRLAAPLTEREMQVLQLIAHGLANKQIAGALSISVKTVGIHRQSILDKLNIHQTAALTRYAIARGIVPCNRPKLIAE